MTKRNSCAPRDQSLESLLGEVTNADISEETLQVKAGDKEKVGEEYNDFSNAVQGSKTPTKGGGNGKSSRRKKNPDDSRVGDESQGNDAELDESFAEPTGFNRYGMTTSTTKRTVNYTSERFNVLLNTFSKVLGVGKAQFLENILRAHFQDHKTSYEELYQEWLKEQHKSPFDV